MDMRSYKFLFLGLVILTTSPTFAEEGEADIVTSETEGVADAEPTPETDGELPETELPPPAITRDPIASEGMPVTSESSTQLAPAERIPPYERERPNSSFQFQTSLQALGDSYLTNSASGTSDYDIKAFGFTYEYLPTFLQAIGVVGLGATFNYYSIAEYTLPNGSTDKLGARNLALYGLGGVARYQAKWFRGQWLVPYVGYEYQRMSYNFTNIGKGSTILSGPVFGALLYMNWMEADAAENLHQDFGIERAYVFAEAKNLSSADEPSLDIDQAIYFGLRVEF